MTAGQPVMRIEVLGSPAILANGQRFEHPARKAMALLVYLAMRADEHLSRSHLASLLWADSAEEQARANLRQTLSQLRKLFQAVGRNPILMPFDKIVLLSQGIEVDAPSILATLDQRSTADLAALSPFAEGLAVQAPEFESWAAAQRRMIQGRLVAHLRQRAAAARDAGRHAEVVEALSLALSKDRLQEDLHRDLMTSMAALGRSDEALQQYELCRAVLRRDLQVDPESATRALAATIRAQRQLRAAEDRQAPVFSRYPAATPALVTIDGVGRTVTTQRFASAAEALGHALTVLRSAPQPRTTRIVVSGQEAEAMQHVEPGQVTVTADVVAQFRHWSPFSFDAGRTLPDGRVTHRLLSELAHHRLQVLPTRPEPAPAEVPEFSVAVLPFHDLTRAASDLSLGELLAEEILHRLSRHRGLTVAAPSAGQAFRSLGHALDKARQMLGVTYLVDGRILRDAERLVVHLTLTDLRQDRLIFSHRFDGLFPGLLLDQNDLADQIASVLFHKTQGAEMQRAERAPTADAGAFEWYLRGLSDHRRSGISPDYARSAFANFSRAIDLDPHFARAIAWRLCAVSWYDPDFLVTPGVAQIQQALSLADDDAEVHRVAGALCMQRAEHDQGIFHLERAIDLNPSDAYLLATSAVYWAYNGMPDRGLPHIDRAMKLDPFLPAWCVEDHGIVLYAMEDYGGAIRSLRRLSAPSLRSMAYLAAALVASGQTDEGKAVVARIRQMASSFTTDDVLSTAYYRRPEDRDRLRYRLAKAGLADRPGV